tara:strand:+ start:204 stop:1124 length:921 start_codon:yes stop_codon:yes gene_type:complete
MRSVSEIEAILEQDGEFRRHFVTRHDPKYASVPDVDFSLFEDDPRVQRFFGRLTEYLTEYPLLEDGFEASFDGHFADRNDWIIKLHRRYDFDEPREDGWSGDVWEYFNRNKLKGDNIVLVRECSRRIGSLLAEDDEYVRSRIDRVSQLIPGSEYLTMLTPEKVERVKEIEDAVYDFYWAVATDEAFEERIHALYEDVVGPMWESGEIRGLPKREGDHYYAVRDLEINYRHLRRVEGASSFYVELANGPLLNIMNRRYLEYGDVGLTREEARVLDGSLAFNREDKDAYISEVKRLLAVQRRIFELTQ